MISNRISTITPPSITPRPPALLPTPQIDRTAKSNEKLRQLKMLEPPPTGAYPDVEALVQATNLHARDQGYAVVKQRSKRNKRGEPHKVYLGCDRGGKYRDKANPLGRSRDTSTRLTGCPFSLVGTCREGQWHLDVRCPGHNHAGSTIPAAHPRHRVLSTETQQAIANLSQAGAKPRTIISSIRLATPDVAICARDVYNARNRLRRQNPGPLIPPQAPVPQPQLSESRSSEKEEAGEDVAAGDIAGRGIAGGDAAGRDITAGDVMGGDFVAEEIARGQDITGA